MMTKKDIESKIFEIKNNTEFENLSKTIFKYQYEHVKVYREYCKLINKSPENVKEIRSIPFLPISIFKNRKIISGNLDSVLKFKSSGTGSLSSRSTHYIADPEIYKKSLLSSFRQFLGNPSQYSMFSLLPGYNENKHSSLIYMVREISKSSRNKKLIHFVNNPENLARSLEKINKENEQSMLFGVSFALMDFAQKYPTQLSHTTIVETGGMKGKKREITRSEMYDFIRKRLNPKKIVSEYGMTELLSQAYATDKTWFKSPPWMKVFIRDIYDPFSIKNEGSGAINVIDLANINSCAFIATDDLAKLRADGKFSVLGRFDHSDIRGCNLLYEED